MRALPLVCLIGYASLAIAPASGQVVRCEDRVYREARDCPGARKPGAVTNSDTRAAPPGPVAVPMVSAAEYDARRGGTPMPNGGRPDRTSIDMFAGAGANWRGGLTPEIAGAAAGAAMNMNRAAGGNIQRVVPPAAQGQVKESVVGGSRVTSNSSAGLPSVASAPRMCPDGSYVSRGPCTMCPDGRYVGGGAQCQMAPDGSYVPRQGNSSPRMTPNGGYIQGGVGTTMCPDGSYVGGGRCVMAPNGRYVGR